MGFLKGKITQNWWLLLGGGSDPKSWLVLNFFNPSQNQLSVKIRKNIQRKLSCWWEQTEEEKKILIGCGATDSDKKQEQLVSQCSKICIPL